MSEQTNLHGTCLAVGRRGVLLLGPSGSGKSDLALRLIDEPGRGAGGNLIETMLVADDQVIVRREGKRLVASAPPSLRGLLEVRGLGIVNSPALAEITLSLALRLVPNGKIERMPGPKADHMDVLGVPLPVLEMAPFHASAAALVRTAVTMCDKLFSSQGEVSACEPDSFTA